MGRELRWWLAFVPGFGIQGTLSCLIFLTGVCSLLVTVVYIAGVREGGGSWQRGKAPRALACVASGTPG